MMDEQEKERELERRIRRRRAQRKRKESKIKWGRFIPSLILIILLIGGIGFGLVKGIGAIYGAYQSHKEATMEATPLPEEAQEPPSVPSVTVNQEALDKPIYVLMAGRDANNPSQADSLYLVSINLDQKLVDIIGIPANTKIDNRDKTGANKINSFYSTGGMDLTKAVVEDIFHISIPYYVVVDQEAFKHTVDVIGTQSFYVESAMNHTDAESGLEDINLKKGYQDLDGNKALQYVRYTDDPQDNFSRVERQERFMKTLLASLQGSMTLTNAWDTWRVWSHFESNISTWDAVKLLYKITHMEATNIHFYILPGHKDTLNGEKYWVVDPSEAQRLVGIMTGDIDASEMASMKPVLKPDTEQVKENTNTSEANVPDNQKSKEERAGTHTSDPKKDKGI